MNQNFQPKSLPDSPYECWRYYHQDFHQIIDRFHDILDNEGTLEDPSLVNLMVTKEREGWCLHIHMANGWEGGSGDGQTPPNEPTDPNPQRKQIPVIEQNQNIPNQPPNLPIISIPSVFLPFISVTYPTQGQQPNGN